MKFVFFIILFSARMINRVVQPYAVVLWSDFQFPLWRCSVPTMLTLLITKPLHTVSEILFVWWKVVWLQIRKYHWTFRLLSYDGYFLRLFGLLYLWFLLLADYEVKLVFKLTMKVKWSSLKREMFGFTVATQLKTALKQLKVITQIV